MDMMELLQETNRIELKQNLSDDLEKEVIAFLNYSEGGSIYIGVTDDGRALGIDNLDAVQLAIKDRLKNNISPSCLGSKEMPLSLSGQKPTKSF